MRSLFFLALAFIIHLSVAQTAEQHYSSASDAFDQQKYKQALKSIDKALRLDSANASYYQFKSDLLKEQKQYMKAFETVNQGIRMCPKTSMLYLQRGNLLLGWQEYDQAIFDFTAAMAYAGNDTMKNSAITNRAAAKLKKRDFTGAYNDLMIAYQFDSTDLATLVNLGAICDEVGKGDETLKYLLKAVEVDSTFYPAYGNIGFKYQEMGQHEKAIAYFNKVLAMNPDEPLGYSNRSYNKLKTGDLKGAMSDIEKSIRLYPANSYAYRIRALIYLEEGRTDKACEDISTALSKGFTESYGDEVIQLQKKHCK
ncbi:MAG: tetratricopeptide repeat protein [Bacteroidales bacterium]